VIADVAEVRPFAFAVENRHNLQVAGLRHCAYPVRHHRGELGGLAGLDDKDAVADLRRARPVNALALEECRFLAGHRGIRAHQKNS